MAYARKDQWAYENMVESVAFSGFMIKLEANVS